ncbi:uncharacterized protein [Spinacia oleracea]|uniref:Uncharacterized protein n=1 Tax=Spinacia oleracea TaxID=3562 RepID=A0A9R0HQD0_SPIOL|nr:uncharacterized protein LOC110774686 [Spinacia oleracea]
MAIDNLPSATTSDESHHSGSYIRNLVKHLTTTKPLNTNQNLINNDALIVGEFNQPSTTTKKGDKLGMTKPNNHHNNHQQQGHKKQVRRRLHTSRPYQERLLNMAEARKEIVTALKFHRASMKQANERKQQPQHEQHHHLQHHQSIFGVQDYQQTCSIVKNEPSSSSLENFSYYPSQNNNSSYTWGNISSPPQPNNMYGTLNNIPLPNQTLGLNLNLQAFTNLDTPFCHDINTTTTYNNNNSNNPSSSSMSPSSSSSSTPRDLGTATTTTTTEGVGMTSGNCMDMHPALDDAEMAVIRSIGEQHQIEMDDTLNLVKSAWWFKYLKTVDFGKEIKGEKVSYDHNNNLPFEELMEFPTWLSANNEDNFLQQHLDDSCSEDTTLPWMDIGDIDGMDDEWLS